MSTTLRKHRELMERDELLLEASLDLLEEIGFASLTLEKIAARTDFSKGTVYNHFTSKEDLLTALCVQGMHMQLDMYRKALGFPGHPRERALALHFAYNLYARRHPLLFRCVLSGLSPHVIEKSSERRMADRRGCEVMLSEVVDRVVQEAVTNKDLILPPGQTVADISFANWATGFGTTALLQTVQKAHSLARLDHGKALQRHVSLLMDGMEWRPLSKDWDYGATWRRLETFFGDEEIQEPIDEDIGAI